MRDVLRVEKDLLVNFARFLRDNATPIAADTVADDKLIESFLLTQLAGPRYVGGCGHCGSDNVEAKDFNDRDGAAAEERGPAWHCQVCFHWTPRVE